MLKRDVMEFLRMEGLALTLILVLSLCHNISSVSININQYRMNQHMGAHESDISAIYGSPSQTCYYEKETIPWDKDHNSSEDSNIFNHVLTCAMCFVVEMKRAGDYSKVCVKVSWISTFRWRICISKDEKLLTCHHLGRSQQSKETKESPSSLKSSSEGVKQKMIEIQQFPKEYKICSPVSEPFSICLSLFDMYISWKGMRLGFCGYFEYTFLAFTRRISLGCVHSKGLKGIDLVATYDKKHQQLKPYGPISLETAQCLLERGYEYASIQVFSPVTGKVIPESLQSVANLRAAGFKQVDIYHYPLLEGDGRGGRSEDVVENAVKQVSTIFQHFHSKMMDYMRFVNALWINVQGTPGINPSHWNTTSSEKNIMFLKSFQKHALRIGYVVGIHTPAPTRDNPNVSWHYFMNNTNLFDRQYLWYDLTDGKHDDCCQVPVPFGGWKYGYVKKYERIHIESCTSTTTTSTTTTTTATTTRRRRRTIRTRTDITKKIEEEKNIRETNVKDTFTDGDIIVDVLRHRNW